MIPPRSRAASGRARRGIVAALLGLLLLGALLGGCGGRDTGGASTAVVAITRPDVGFRSAERLDEHYRKHGREFGSISRDDYLRLAQALRDGPVGGAVLQAVRQDGVITRFDRASGAFVAFDDDGVIRTFFVPNDGERYFQRQAQR
jgi:hypothetical protein